LESRTTILSLIYEVRKGSKKTPFLNLLALIVI